MGGCTAARPGGADCRAAGTAMGTRIRENTGAEICVPFCIFLGVSYPTECREKLPVTIYFFLHKGSIFML